ncbi:MAG: hypothetical protein AAF734_00740 [Bacteroidota bacterium]
MNILDKDSIKREILLYLPHGKRGKKMTEAQMIGIVGLILYRLKTGCQWEQLPISSFLSGSYSYKTFF